MLWMRLGQAQLGAGARLEIEQAWRAGEVCVSAISFWEVALLKDKGRIRFPEDVAIWRREQLGQGVVEIPVDGETGIRANDLADFHADPAGPPDRCYLVGRRPSASDVRPRQYSPPGPACTIVSAKGKNCSSELSDGHQTTYRLFSHILTNHPISPKLLRVPFVSSTRAASCPSRVGATCRPPAK